MRPHDGTGKAQAALAEFGRSSRDIVSIEEPFNTPTKPPRLLDVIDDELCAGAEELGLEVEAPSPTATYERITRNTRATKSEVAEAMVKGGFDRRQGRILWRPTRAAVGCRPRTMYRLHVLDALAIAKTVLKRLLTASRARRRLAQRMSPFTEHIGNFQSLVSSDWFKRPEESSIWLRLYTSLLTPPEHLSEAVRLWSTAKGGSDRLLSFAGSVLFGAGTIDGLTLPFPRMDLFSNNTGQLQLELHVAQRTLPPAGYIFLGVPFRKDGAPGDESSAKRTLDAVAGLICLHAGRSFMWECVFEGEVSGKDGSYSVPTPARKMPQPADGPFLSAQSGEEVAEISERLKATTEPRRSRLELALQLMDAAIRKDQGFFEYWTALEVVCDGKGGRIKDRFAKAYGLKNIVEANRQSGLEVLTRWRGDYVHKGRAPFLSADVERYVQLLFLDLLRFELGLALRGLAGAMQSVVGVDLSSIGLRDNRTEEQKRTMVAPLEGSTQDAQASHSPRDGTEEQSSPWPVSDPGQTRQSKE